MFFHVWDAGVPEERCCRIQEKAIPDGYRYEIGIVDNLDQVWNRGSQYGEKKKGCPNLGRRIYTML